MNKIPIEVYSRTHRHLMGELGEIHDPLTRNVVEILAYQVWFRAVRAALKDDSQVPGLPSVPGPDLGGYLDDLIDNLVKIINDDEPDMADLRYRTASRPIKDLKVEL